MDELLRDLENCRNVKKASRIRVSTEDELKHTIEIQRQAIDSLRKRVKWIGEGYLLTYKLDNSMAHIILKNEKEESVRQMLSDIESVGGQDIKCYSIMEVNWRDKQ